MPFGSSSWARPATSRATVRPSAPRISCATNASRSDRRPRERSTPGSSSAGAGTGACPFAGASSAATARLNASLAEQGLGLAYALEPMVIEQLRTRRLKRGPRAVRPYGSRLLPLLPERRTAIRAAPPLRRSGQGAGREGAASCRMVPARRPARCVLTTEPTAKPASSNRRSPTSLPKASGSPPQALRTRASSSTPTRPRRRSWPQPSLWRRRTRPLVHGPKTYVPARYARGVVQLSR